MADVSSTTPNIPPCVPGPSGLQADQSSSSSSPSKAVTGIHAVSSSAIVAAGGGGSTTNGSSDTPIRPRKRPRRTENWKKNVAKAKRAKGEAYVSPSTGSLVPAHKTGPACKCKSRKCYQAFNDREKKRDSATIQHALE